MFKGKVAIVLGASAEQGTGWAVAERLAAEGAKVLVGARRVEPLKKLAERIGGAALACDVADEAQVSHFAQFALATFGRVDIAVNASGYATGASIDQASEEELLSGTKVNYFGAVYFVRHAARAMANGGSIILFSSLAVTKPLPIYFPYSCGKAALECLVNHAALEYGPRGIRVNSIRPGAIRSEMSTVFFSDPAFEHAYARDVPLGRVGEPSDFADAVVSLAASAYLTGLNIEVSGGRHLVGRSMVR